ncbi:MAG: DNA repair protein RecN [Halothiobacillaceae bacterium]|nr:DNA repair protein RecN [Halothiobacillaceae bacterium]HER35611.1 DNA repair protein RecN [Halothiobacillaceae bacterium]
MLTSLSIRQIALIDQLEIDFATGMTALTGETGAGKSILIDAIGLLLGDRANMNLLRAGCDQGEVSGEFRLPVDSPAARWLAEQELGDEPEGDSLPLIVRRLLSRDGRSKAWINGRPLPGQALKGIGRHLIDIHGQHQNQRLMQGKTQLALLDHFCDLKGEVDELGRLAREIHTDEQQLAEYRAEQASRADRLAFLDFQLEEIERVDPQPDEFNQLHAELKRLTRLDEWRQVLADQMAALFDEDGNAHDRIGAAEQALSRIADLDEALGPVIETLQSAEIQIAEAVDTLRGRLESAEADPERLATVEQRLDTLHELARKHRVAPEAFEQHAQDLREEHERLKRAGGSLDETETRLARNRADYDRLAAEVSKKRASGASKLATRLKASIRELGMPNGEFEVRLSQPETLASRRGDRGIDDVVFQISANRGQPVAPLDQIASGGELSRVSLALKTLTAGDDPVGTFIFDEVDTGIGGATAAIVGAHLRALGESRQVLCVTHLPQVAAHGHHQARIEKEELSDATRTWVRSLDTDQRIDELARMLGGRAVTDQTRAHARELLDSSV